MPGPCRFDRKSRCSRGISARHGGCEAADMLVALRRWFVVGGIVFLAGCSPPYGSSDVKTTMNGRARLISAEADQDLTWTGSFKIENAPKGEYLLFFSETRPSSPVNLAGFDLATCKDTCEVPGLGRLGSRATSDGTSNVELSGSSGFADDADHQYYVIVRRGEELAPAAVTGRIGVEGGSACTNPDGPELSYDDLEVTP